MLVCLVVELLDQLSNPLRNLAFAQESALANQILEQRLNLPCQGEQFIHACLLTPDGRGRAKPVLGIKIPEVLLTHGKRVRSIPKFAQNQAE
ncbi:MAG: hypothetical protein WBV28_14650 [Terracidiphilus sp.]